VLNACCQAANIELPNLPFFCTLKGSRRALRLESHRLSCICEHLSIPLNHHHAGSDATACARLYLHLCDLGVAKQDMLIK
jgi:DNA polymerase-3 subunit epsilon